MKFSKSLIFISMTLANMAFADDSDLIGTPAEQQVRVDNLNIYTQSTGADRGELLFTQSQVEAITNSACANSLAYLADKYSNNAATIGNFITMNSKMHSLPESYIGVYPLNPDTPEGEDPSALNPWEGGTPAQLFQRTIDVFTNWCQFLPDIEGDKDTGLAYIQEFAWFYYRNDLAKLWVQGEDPEGGLLGEYVGYNFVNSFTTERGTYMDSSDSLGLVDNWTTDDRIEIEDYTVPEGGFSSWNDFFTRSIIIDVDADSGAQTIRDRPVTKPDEDYIISSPTDCIMNPLTQVLSMDDTLITETAYIENPLELNDVIDVKNTPISIKSLLGDATNEMKNHFVGGTGLSCVLMPNTYHSFHTPVSGEVIYKEVVNTGTYGYPDFVNWVPLSGNVGRSGTDFSQFQKFQRGVVIIEVQYDAIDDEGQTVSKTGYVASIPVGLDTIGSVVLSDEFIVGDTVKRGFTRLGNFRYGGSLDILLFSKGMVAPAIQTRLGAQIAIIDAGTTPEVSPAIPASNSGI
ncbi:phosphatidylserine decarboxylase [Shewanella psychropiezotolerans]|uniref:Phosphatidylserine decarboxylase n=1 Tax=Shewanella psychropiezotolerans TaxID=2593655 RepID=A0ABX5WW44_9GAMM|nr:MULTISPECIES: phosphatidylserine decarboxylase [Shewanella]MPY22343.1 phosphatidylserine decarboxylase [Shewanella sp. YLB-07]QDO83321.1 phosphatidylserine decarboxylase [Shewanella psychropiezotolerans]